MTSSLTDRNSVVPMVSSVKAADKTAVENLEHSQSCDTVSHELQQLSDSKNIHEPENHQDSLMPKKQTGNPDALVPEEAPVEPYPERLHSEGSISSSVLSDKPSKTPVRAIHPMQHGLERSSPVIREKVSEDGFNWRKYGQKLVKGNEFIRSYYKCTHPKCVAKKQLERSHDGQIIDTFSFGQHDHPKPNCTPIAVGLVVSIVEERQDETSSSAAKEKSLKVLKGTLHQPVTTDTLQLSAISSSDDMKDAQVQSNRMKNEADKDDHQSPKRRKKDKDSEANPVDKSTGGPRRVVQTQSEVDVVNDGYRWRKYGQKLVKGSPHPRSYYRCSSPGCQVKKHVERASHDSKLLLTTYEGQHDHDMPPSRTVTPMATGSESHKAANNKDSLSIIEVSTAVSGPESKSNEQ